MKAFLATLRDPAGVLLCARTTVATDDETLDGIANGYLRSLPPPFNSYELAHAGQLHHQLSQRYNVAFGPFSATLDIELQKAVPLPKDGEPQPADADAPALEGGSD